MSLNKPQSLGFFFLSIFISMALRIAPWPAFFEQINPDWILLTLIYWALATPDRTGILSAWGIGLITDVLTGRALGQYALAYPLAIYFCIKKHISYQARRPIGDIGSDRVQLLPMSGI